MNPCVSNQRFLLAGGSYCTQQTADVVRAALPVYAATRRIPAGTVGRRQDESHFSCGTDKARDVLGIRFQGLSEAVVPLAKWCLAWSG